MGPGVSAMYLTIAAWPKPQRSRVGSWMLEGAHYEFCYISQWLGSDSCQGKPALELGTGASVSNSQG